jgi:glycosyltransferase involved in cell wall biosynthesis
MLDKKPLVSVITPSYNQGQFIKRTIESVLSQNYTNIEYIVIDGGSTDDTINILKSYNDKISWISEPDKGQSDALNKGLAMAKGQIIGWLNSDDLYLPGAINTAVSVLTKNPEFELVYGKGYIIDKEDNITGSCVNTAPYKPNILSEGCIICQPAAFFTKSLVDKVGGINPELHYCMDYDLWIRMSKNTKFWYLSDYLASFRLYEECKTMSKNFELIKESLNLMKNYYGFIHPRWIVPYIRHFCGGKKLSIKFWALLFVYFFKFNYKNPLFILSFPFKLSTYTLITEFYKKNIKNK